MNKKYLLCRDQENSVLTHNKLQKLGFDSAIFPLYEVNHLSIIASFKKYDAAIITSLNVIKSQKIEYWQKLNQKEIFFVIGENLANYFKNHQINNLKIFNSVVELAEHIRANKEIEDCIYFRGKVISYDLAHHLLINVDEIICYEINYFDISYQKISDFLEKNNITDLIFFSKNVAENFREIFIKADKKEKLMEYEIFCLSPRIAKIFFGLSTHIHFPKKANFNSLIKIL